MRRRGTRPGDRFNRLCDRLIAMHKQIGLPARVTVIVRSRVADWSSAGHRVVTLPRRNGR